MLTELASITSCFVFVFINTSLWQPGAVVNIHLRTIVTNSEAVIFLLDWVEEAVEKKKEPAERQRSLCQQRPLLAFRVSAVNLVP